MDFVDYLTALKKNKYVRMLYFRWKTVYLSVKGWIFLFIVKTAPEFHAKREIARQNNNVLKQKRLNIREPENFAEKMLYLKYFVYNKSFKVAQCYNKFEVREYIKKKGCEEVLNELYGAWDSIEEIPWESLPDEYVMKVSNGYSNHVFKRKGQEFSVEDAVQKLKKSLRVSSYYFKISGDLFAYGTKQKIICERMLPSNWGYVAPEDYKFYCFHGEPKYCEIMWDRYGEGHPYNEVFVDINMKDCHELEAEAGKLDETIQFPECMNEMIDYAKRLSQDFPFVRVDFYVTNGRPIFGELTFTPMHSQTYESMTQLGQLIDINRIKEYSALFNK